MIANLRHILWSRLEAGHRHALFCVGGQPSDDMLNGDVGRNIDR